MTARPARVAVIGSGPTGTAFLERLVANAGDVLGGRPLEIHLVDPHPPGAGRVWRYEQSPLLWMNSMAEDVTMFPDDSVECEGPIVPGPPLDQWATVVRDDELPSPAVVREVRALDGMSFPTRQLQSAYLAWVLDRVRAQAPPGVHVVQHATTAIDVTGGRHGAQVVHLVDEPAVEVDVVVLALGHLDVEPTPEHRPDVDFAEEHGLLYVPPAYTADLELDAIEPGAPVIVRGLGLAFIDLLVLLTEGRGGRFVDGDDGRLRYEPSGREPVLHVGSRRGVPYRSKIGYRLLGPRAPLPRFFDNAAIARLLAGRDRVDFLRDVWPLLAKDVAWGYYHELFHAHPARTTQSWPDFDARFAPLTWDSAALHALVAEAVPADEDRFDVDRLDRPLAGRHFATSDDLQAHVRHHVEADRARRADPVFSADLGAFYALLSCFVQLAQVIGSGRLTPRSRVEDADGWWFGFFSYFASGPPAARLDQLVALSRAGVVRFLGADLWVARDEEHGRFRAGSASTDEVVEAGVLVEARLPASSLSRTRSSLLRAMRDRGELLEQVLADPVEAYAANTGKLRVDRDLRVLDAGETAHPRRFALGIHTSRPASGTFARPRTNALPFRQNDAVARTILFQLAALADVADALPTGAGDDTAFVA